MNRLVKWSLLTALTVSLASCGGRRTVQDDDLALDEPGMSDGAGADSFDEFDAPEGQDNSGNSQAAAGDDDFNLDDDMGGGDNTASSGGSDGGADDPFAAEPEPQAGSQPDSQASNFDSGPDPFATPEPSTPEPSTSMSEPVSPPPSTVTSDPSPAPSARTVNITGIKFKGNDNGGTVVIEGDGPLSYVTRRNPEMNQYIIEIANANLPARLQRPLNTRDMQGIIGAIDPYQTQGSNTARVVLQLREGASDPAVQVEGNSLLVVASGSGANYSAANNSSGGSIGDIDGAPRNNPSFDSSGNVELNSSGILSSQSLAEYLSGNTKFYGKRISIEMNNMDVRDAIRFITEESGANMIISEDVKGAISLKLRQVPWDQALVMVMKARGLGYSRQGNVLRITSLEALKKEEEDATALAKARRGVEPLKVRMYQISYADIVELEKKVAGFLSERGKAVGDVRTSSIVVTDIEENLTRIAKLLASLDIQPSQVLIESKIVEATEAFSRTLGVRWNWTPEALPLGGSATARPSFDSSPLPVTGSMFAFNLGVGVLDVLGTLDASLALSEREEKVKIISSPRILTMSNEIANISQTTEVPVRAVTVQNGVQTITFSFKPLTLKLGVTPQITADSSIIMKVDVKREFRGATIDTENDAFTVNSREANTKVLVRNGQTAVIGGVYQSDAAEAEMGVPYLKDIPVLGALFKGKTVNKDKSELLIFLTPRILARTDLGGASPSMSKAGGGDL